MKWRRGSNACSAQSQCSFEKSILPSIFPYSVESVRLFLTACFQSEPLSVLPEEPALPAMAHDSPRSGESEHAAAARGRDADFGREWPPEKRPSRRRPRDAEAAVAEAKIEAEAQAEAVKKYVEQKEEKRRRRGRGRR